MSRPQISIDRLAAQRLSSEPKEAMNCKSCRKRKIKCNRLRPSCEACRVFKCPCIYDAIPKKRGPKTDVLEALVKRVNQMERALEAEGKAIPPREDALEDTRKSVDEILNSATTATQSIQSAPTASYRRDSDHKAELPARPLLQRRDTSATVTEQNAGPQGSPALNVALLDLYFSRLHNKPFYILDENATRQRWQSGQLPLSVSSAISAVAARYATHMVGGHNAKVRLSDDYTMQARASLDVDEPSIENIQVALLLSLAYFQAGKGRKSYMLLSSAVCMAFAQGLHRELPADLRIAPTEREGRRRLFWTCYIMDKTVACGSKRPSLINDDSIALRLPAWQADSTSMPFEGSFFTSNASAPLGNGPGRPKQSDASTLIGIIRILGTTNQYLAAGGVKGDSHFPWHMQSNLSRIRQHLDTWAASTHETFSSFDTVFGNNTDPTLLLSKLVYHLVHCLIYRPFLPIDLGELAGTGQHQSWQMEATNLCFIHANAIAEVVDTARRTSSHDLPPFVGYCLCTAGTVHVHGALYSSHPGDLFSRSAEFLSREMAELSNLRLAWAGVQHQRETLRTIYACHSQLVRSLSSNPMRFSPVFQMEDFFDRYPGYSIDGAYMTFADIVVESLHESLPAYTSLNTAWPQLPAESPATLQPANFPRHSIEPDVQFSNDSRKRRRTNDVMEDDAYSALPSIPEPTAAFASQGAADDTSQPMQQQQKSTTATLPLDSPSTTAFDQTITPPPFTFSPWASTSNFSLAPGMLDNTDPQSQFPLDSFFSLPHQAVIQDHQTPGGMSVASGSAHTEGDKDPFMSLLEQLAENEQSRSGGPSDLDFFLNG